MSFSARVKSELTRVTGDKKCCALAELSALVRMAGMIELKNGHTVGLRISNENARVIGRAYAIIKQNFQLPMKIYVTKREKLKKNNVYSIAVPASKGTFDMLKALGIFQETQDNGVHMCYGIHPLLLKRDCCRRAYIRGAFLGGGSISDPEKAYHLEFVVFYEELAKDVCRLITSYGLKAKMTDRKGLNIVYLKEGEHIVHLLNIMGAHTALLDLENVRIVKDMRNRVNRLVNCETANLNKTIDAALRQTESIDYIIHNYGIEKLPRSLREIAAARLNNPDMSLKELGMMVDPPLSKSGVSHRLRKIDRLAEKLKKNKEK